MVYNCFESQVLSVEDVRETARYNKVMLIPCLGFLLKAKILNLRKLGLEWVIRREEKIWKDLLEIVPLTVLELHNLLKFLIRDDLAIKNLSSSFRDEVASRLKPVLLEHTIKQGFFLCWKSAYNLSRLHLSLLALVVIVLFILADAEKVMFVLFSVQEEFFYLNFWCGVQVRDVSQV